MPDLFACSGEQLCIFASIKLFNAIYLFAGFHVPGGDSPAVQLCRFVLGAATTAAN